MAVTGTDAAARRCRAAAARTRRRFARRQWARRWGAWKWVAAVVLLVAVWSPAGVWLVFFSSVLAVQGVTVTGTGYLTADQIRAAAEVPTGEPLARVDLEAVTDPGARRWLRSQSVEVTRAWPDQIRIEVTERTAVAVVDVGGTVRGMDADGVLFREYPAAPATCPWCGPSRARTPTRAARPRRWSPRCPRTWPPGRPPRGADRRPDHAGAPRRADRGLGECGAVGREGPGAGAAAGARRAAVRRQRPRPADHRGLITGGNPRSAPRVSRDRAAGSLVSWTSRG